MLLVGICADKLNLGYAGSSGRERANHLIGLRFMTTVRGSIRRPPEHTGFRRWRQIGRRCYLREAQAAFRL